MADLSVPWPASPLSEQEWRRAMEATAEAAERMVGKPANHRELAQMALHWVGLIWPAIGPETIAASCRASLLVGAPGVVVATAVVDQLDEIHSRLDELYCQAQGSVLEVGPPMVHLPPGSHLPKGRPPRQPVLEPEALELDAGIPAPEPEPEPPEKPTAPPPPSWLSTADTCELLSICRRTAADWRESGRFGPEGVGYVHHGRGYWHSPEAVEAIEAGNMPPELDALLSELQAA